MVHLSTTCCLSCALATIFYFRLIRHLDLILPPRVSILQLYNGNIDFFDPIIALYSLSCSPNHASDIGQHLLWLTSSLLHSIYCSNAAEGKHILRTTTLLLTSHLQRPHTTTGRPIPAATAPVPIGLGWWKRDARDNGSSSMHLRDRLNSLSLRKAIPWTMNLPHLFDRNRILSRSTCRHRDQCRLRRSSTTHLRLHPSAPARLSNIGVRSIWTTRK